MSANLPSSLSGSNGFTLIVAGQAASSGQGRFMTFGSNAGTGGQVIGVVQNGSFDFNNGSNGFGANMHSSPAIGVFRRAFGADYGQSEFILNGTAQIGSAVSGSSVPNLPTSGSEILLGSGRAGNGNLTNPFAGLIKEVMLFAGALNDFEVRRLEGYLAWKWGTQASLTDGHPFKSQRPLFGGDQNITVAANNLTVDPSDNLPRALVFDQPFGLEGSYATSGLNIVYETNDSSVLQVDSNGLLRPMGTGTVRITLKQPGDSHFSAASNQVFDLKIVSNDPPTNLNSTAPLNIAENQPVGTVVGDFNATDPDAGATLTYHLVSGVGDGNNSLFTLETNGTLKTATTFDYETNASTYFIRVQAKDEFNATVEGNFTVTLTDQYEAPPGQSNNDGNSSSDSNSTTGETNPVVDGNTTTDPTNPVLEGNASTGETNPVVDGNSTNEGNATIPSPVPDYFRPLVDTLPAGEVNGTTAKLHGSVMDTGGLTPTEFGFLLSSRPNPKENASGVIRLAAESNASAFSAVAAGLMAGKTYYFRAFAVNAEGIGYGFEESFETPAGLKRPTWIEAVPGTVKDWWTSPWLGNFYLSANGWARHEKLGWVFPVQSPSAGLWLWKEGFGWLWTDESIYPFLYRNVSGGWLYFFGRREETLLFYDYSTKGWITRKAGQ